MTIYIQKQMKLYNQSAKLTITMDMPDFSFENQLFAQKGEIIIGGVDEVGRGCLAGPVVAACVVFNSAYIRCVKTIEVTIKDSKKMSAIQREKADKWIKDNCLYFGIGEATVDQINELGIKPAADIAFRNAITNCQEKCKIQHLLCDAFYIPNVVGLENDKQTPIIKGDNKSISIAAASIIAKVYRDTLMTKLATNKKYACYGWDKNKGYGTKYHRQAILQFGVTSLHREKFIRNLLEGI